MPRPKLDRPNYRLRKRGSTWVINWTEGGKPKSVSTRETDEDRARRVMAQWVADREAPEPPHRPTIAEILNGYIEDRRGHVEDLGRLELASTVIKRHLGEIRPEQLASRVFWQRRKGDGVSAGTIVRDGATLRAALHWAVKAKWLDRAPFVALPSKGPPRERFLSRVEADKLIAAAKAPHIRLFILIALNTGARRGAILDLDWGRVDFEHRLIFFRRAGRAESKKRRATVPINDALIGPLQEAAKTATTEWVIEYRGRKAGNIRHAFERSVERAGIPYCTRHDLRRTAASWMMMGRVPVEEIAKMLGDTVEMIEKVYGRFSPDYLREAARALAGPVSLTPVESIRKTG